MVSDVTLAYVAGTDSAEGSVLHREILHALGVPHADRRTLASTSATIDAAHRLPPAELAKLAPLILTAVEGGNVEARLIVRRAAEHLTASLNTIRLLGATSPIVLGGSLLTTPNPLSQTVRASVRKIWPDAEIHRAGGGAAAAAWLAGRQLSGLPALQSHALYTRLLDAERIPPHRPQQVR